MDLGVIVVGNDLLDGQAVLPLRNRHRPHVGLQLPGFETVDEFLELLRLEVPVGLHPELLLLGEAADAHVLAVVFEAECSGRGKPRKQRGRAIPWQGQGSQSTLISRLGNLLSKVVAA